MLDKNVTLNLEYTKLHKNRAFLPSQIIPFQSRVNKVHDMFMNRTGKGSEFMGWVDQPVNFDKQEVVEILAKVDDLQQRGVEILLVIGIGGSSLGSKSGIDFVRGSSYRSEKVIYIGTDISADHIKEVEDKLKDRKWAIAAISKSGTTLEPALAFRHFRKLLYKVQVENTNEYIVAITDKSTGALKKLSDIEGYKTFVIPNNIGGRFSGMTPAGLFPMAFAGVNIKQVLLGAAKARKELLGNPSLETNDAYIYAVARNYLGMKRTSFVPDQVIAGKTSHWSFKFSKRYYTEMFVTWTPDLIETSEWVKQLIGESLSKNGKGVLPASTTFTRDLHSLGQTLQQGNKSFFETMLWVQNERNTIDIVKDEDNLDGLNYLSNSSFNDINVKTLKAVTESHYKGKVPVMIINLLDKSEETLGYLWYFFFIATTISGYLEGVNPFNQPGVEVYKTKMFENLGKPKG